MSIKAIGYLAMLGGAVMLGVAVFYGSGWTRAEVLLGAVGLVGGHFLVKRGLPKG